MQIWGKFDKEKIKKKPQKLQIVLCAKQKKCKNAKSSELLLIEKPIKN